jgi:hypothetical protein
MTTPHNKHKAPRRPAARHPAHARRQGLRNAAPRAPRASRATTATDEHQPPREPTFFERAGYTALGMGGASIAGALASRWGFHPLWFAAGATGAGALLMARYNTRNKNAQAASAGAFSAGGSQLVLMMLQQARAQAQAPAQQVASMQPAQPAKDGTRRQLGALPPGALDAAFERARSTLTMDAEGHEYAYGHPGYPGY